MNREQNLKGHKNVICCIFSVVILIVLLFPLYWTLVTSLKTEQEIFQIPPTLWPNVLNTKSYTAQLDHGDFNMFRSFGNSLLISLGATVISVVLAVPASYGIAKYKFRFRKGVLLTFLVTQMLPVSVLLTPMFLMFKNMHLYNTWLSAILADATIGIPFSVLILKNYFASIPNEMEEAAYIDGCGKFGSFFRVLIPIGKTGHHCLRHFLLPLCMGRSGVFHDVYSRAGGTPHHRRYLQLHGTVRNEMELSDGVCHCNDHSCRTDFHFHAEIHHQRYDKRRCKGVKT